MVFQNEFADPDPPNRARTPLVDVNLVTYNHDKFISKAIESVLEQKTDFEYRLIVGDDCSTDATQSIIRNYALQYPERIQLLIAPEHRGIQHKDRVGMQVLRLSTAKYVALLDGDDYWTDPHKLQKQIDFLETNIDFAVCFHNVKVSYDDHSREPWNYCPPDQKEISTLEDLLDRNFIATSSAVFRRECLGELPDWFLKIKSGDWLIYILSALNGKLGYLNEVMSVYRIHHAGLWTRQSSVQNTLAEIAMFKALARYLPDKYRRQAKSHVASLFGRLADEYSAGGQKTKALVSVARSFVASPGQSTISYRRVPHILVPGVVSRLKALMGSKSS